MENLKSEKFKKLTKVELNLVSGGGIIWPTKGTEQVGQTATNPAGYTYKNVSDWKTGWFDTSKDYGNAYQVDDNGNKPKNGGF